MAISTIRPKSSNVEAGGLPVEGRYRLVSGEKAGGVTYTPDRLATFVARQIVDAASDLPPNQPLRLLDPAVGHGELLLCLLEELQKKGFRRAEVHGFDVDRDAIAITNRRIRERFPDSAVEMRSISFLDFLVGNGVPAGQIPIVNSMAAPEYDLIIANPPYVRTQIMGAHRSRRLSREFELSGRADLYYAFVLAIADVLSPVGVAGIIVSNRFMTTKSGAVVRRRLRERLALRHVWDMGDTKLFNAAVLPAVVLACGSDCREQQTARFTSIYQSNDEAQSKVKDPINALDCSGVAEVTDGRRFHVRHGRLHTSDSPDGVWRMATDATDQWLNAVEKRTWACFGDIGKIRVGVKTCADKVFIGEFRDGMTEEQRPELLRPLTTHRIARRFKPLSEATPTRILYPHEVADGARRAVDLTEYPRSHAYLEKHRKTLEARKYVKTAGRKWYEIWVPQDPSAWALPKLVFRDITDRPMFWVDMSGSVVNGDCYWLTCRSPKRENLLWLAAAVGNSTFIEQFYDIKFPNRLYAQRRRFMMQYVQEFPLPDPRSKLGLHIIALAQRIYEKMPSRESRQLEQEVDAMVWRSLTGEAAPSRGDSLGM